MKRPFLILPALLLSLVFSAVLADDGRPFVSNLSPISLPNVSPTNSDLANRGAYIARTADCMTCHREDYTSSVFKLI